MRWWWGARRGRSNSEAAEAEAPTAARRVPGDVGLNWAGGVKFLESGTGSKEGPLTKRGDAGECATRAQAKSYVGVAVAGAGHHELEHASFSAAKKP